MLFLFQDDIAFLQKKTYGESEGLGAVFSDVSPGVSAQGSVQGERFLLNKL